MQSSSQRKLTKAELAYIQALFTLLETRPFDEISITDLSKISQYDRRSYYRHFSCKEDIITLYCRTIIDEMATSLMARGNLTLKNSIIAYFEFWDNHIDFLHILSKNHLLPLLAEQQDELIYQHVGRKIQPCLSENYSTLPSNALYASHFTYGGFFKMLTWWIKETPRKSPEEIADYITAYIAELNHFLT